MSDIKIFAAIAFSCVAAYGFAAPSPVGSWTGHLALTPGPKATPQQKQQIAMYQSKASKSHITLTLKGDHTFISDVKGIQQQHKAGKWSVKGNSVILTTPQGSQPFTISGDGKSMTFKLPAIPGISGEVKFTR